MVQLTALEVAEQPILARVRTYLVSAFGPITSFTQFVSPHEHREYYPVALVTLASGSRIIAKWGTKPEKIEKEFIVSKLLLAHGIPTPVPIRLVKDIPLVLMEPLDGRELTVGDLTPATVQEIGATLRRIHDIPATEVADAGVPAWPGVDFLDETEQKLFERLTGALESPAMPHGRATIAQAFSELKRRTHWQGYRGLNRRDMHPGNWFRTAVGSLAAIDHGNASIGDVAYDLAHMLSKLHDDQRLSAAFRAGYGADRFDQATTQPVRALMDLSHGLGIVGWVHRRAVPQPEFQAEGLCLIQRALSVAKGETE